MPIRWVISPIVTATETDAETGASYTYPAPKVTTLIEPGRGKPYQCASAQGGAFALSFVRAADFSGLTPDCIDLLARDYDDVDSFLARTPRGDGWNVARTNALLAKLTARGVDVTGLSRDTDFAAILRRLGRAFDQNFEPLHVGARPG